ncbi:MAG: transcription-repair coupling factor [Saprospiraceae bacterium]|nr:transcription-repair coupling factor [Saprospiraceae bacterium]MBP7679558.1 transcription-repair coupling factor [Saprospiraceae bacterium]
MRRGFPDAFDLYHYLCCVEQHNLQRIIGLYRDDKRTLRLLQYIHESPTAPLQLNGLVGAQTSFVIAGAYLNEPRHYLIIATDKEEAAYIENNLESLLEGKNILLFPDSFKRPQFFDDLNSGNVLLRTETINKLSSSNALGEIVVTYPEALFEMVVAPVALAKTRIEVIINETLDVDFLIETLVEYGFERATFVFEPGQFSVRGGIIDIFSYGNELPYRIELFDDKVESIRTFDPSSQLSRQKIAKVSIVPNVNTKFTQTDKTSLFKVLPTNTLIWTTDLQNIIDRLQSCFDKAVDFAKTISATDESDLAELFRDQAFIAPNSIIRDMEQYPIVILTTNQQPVLIHQTFTYSSRPQPSFNKNFDLLISDLRENEQHKCDTYLFTENPKQVARFYAIFDDLQAHVSFHPIIKAIDKGFIDLDLNLACYTDHQIFERYHKYHIRQGFTKDTQLSVRLLRDLQTGDFVTHIDHGVGKYSGLEKLTINGHTQEAVRLVYKNNDILYVGIHSLHKISKYVGKDGAEPKLNKLGSDTWENLKRKTKRQIKDIAGELIKLYAKRRAAKGFAFSTDGYLQNELEASFLYEDTPDQLQATIDVKEDMQKQYPMDRLICGDVGFGKTEVAIRAAFKAVCDGKQVAVLVPTTILALQHYKTFSERLKPFDIHVNYINRFKSAKQKKEILTDVANGKVEVIIGTHALLSNETKFKDLGLLVVDEEQKFGVSHKEKLRNFKVNVDTLTLTATPIPRTLQFSLMSARDMSVIRTPPPNRQPIQTEVRVMSEDLIRDAIEYEINRGGQVFFVHNRVKSLPEVAEVVQRVCPHADVAIAHGQLDSDKLEQVLVDFIDRQYDVLICTNIIETGLDIPNANTMIITNAHQFGLSDLHQLRGRVGRSNRKAFCYLLCPPLSVLTSDARKRLKTLEEFSELGDGINIAMRDLDIRGAGNLLGAEQSGFIAEIGYETYQKILEEAIQELKENEFKDVFEEDLAQQHAFVRDVQIDTDAEMHLPDSFVENVQERLALYNELDRIENEAQLTQFADTLRDRFGRLPQQVLTLFDALRLRWECKQLGFERLILKNDKLRCYFVNNPQSAFYETANFRDTLHFITKQSKALAITLKQTNNTLIMVKDNVRSLKQARELLWHMINEIGINKKGATTG